MPLRSATIATQPQQEDEIYSIAVLTATIFLFFFFLFFFLLFLKEITKLLMQGIRVSISPTTDSVRCLELLSHINSIPSWYRDSYTGTVKMNGTRCPSAQFLVGVLRATSLCSVS